MATSWVRVRVRVRARVRDRVRHHGDVVRIVAAEHGLHRLGGAAPG